MEYEIGDSVKYIKYEAVGEAVGDELFVDKRIYGLGLITKQLSNVVYEVFATPENVFIMVDKSHLMERNIHSIEIPEKDILESLLIDTVYTDYEHCVLMYLVRTSRSYDLQILDKCAKYKNILVEYLHPNRLEILKHKIDHYQRRLIT